VWGACSMHVRRTHGTLQGTLCLCPQASKPGLFDHLVDNTEFGAVYLGLKEAISTLSPIIRNRCAQAFAEQAD
jgi:hypothetical protein